MRACEDVWKRTPTERREGMLLEALGSERLLIRELMLRVNTELLGGVERKHRAVYESNIRSAGDADGSRRSNSSERRKRS